MIKASLREKVRQRADFACEFCGISETDAGGRLTVDHFRPRSRGGDDSIDNLLYCCARCNQYKLDYWPIGPDVPHLWNPRHEPATQHFLELEDGTLQPITPTGVFTLRRLRLNRPPLVAHRLRMKELRQLERYRDLARLLESLLRQQTLLLEEQQRLLREQQRLLQILAD
jgi:CRISPR/Cas system Type II protein with McrA/HNH and RuvC-like nuclease domain